MIGVGLSGKVTHPALQWHGGGAGHHPASPAVSVGSGCSASSATLGVVRLLSFSHFYGRDVVTHCGFNLRVCDEGCCRLCCHHMYGPFVHLLFRSDCARLLPLMMASVFLSESQELREHAVCSRWGWEAALTPRDRAGFLPMRALSCGGRGRCCSTGYSTGGLGVSTVCGPRLHNSRCEHLP